MFVVLDCCRGYLERRLIISKVNSNFIVVYRWSKKDNDRVFKDILERLHIPPHHVRYSSRIGQITIDDLITFKFYSGDLYNAIGIGNMMYNADTWVASEFFKSRGGVEINDIYQFVDYLVEELKSPI